LPLEVQLRAGPGGRKLTRRVNTCCQHGAGEVMGCRGRTIVEKSTKAKFEVRKVQSLPFVEGGPNCDVTVTVTQ
jgi:hypothetical protein